MTSSLRLLSTVLLVCLATRLLAQTEGGARMHVRLHDYNGSSTKHWCVAWVTTERGIFIKTLRKQGPSSWTASHWSRHCQLWWDAKGGSTGSQALDGYTSATAPNYSGTNSPVILTWNCRDASDQLVPDGRYKFWVQYAEDSGQGPYITNGLLWEKGPDPASLNYADQSPNFSNMSVVWTPVPPPHVTSAKIVAGHLLLVGTGPAGKSYHVLSSGDIAAPLETWQAVGTNSFDGTGSFGFATPVDPGASRVFYVIQAQ